MRRLAAICAALLLGTGIAGAEPLKSHRLTIGDQVVEIDVGGSAEVTLPDGSTTTVTLKRNEFATYAGGNFSFNYPTSLSVARSDVGDNIVQHLMASALGTLVIVQEYARLDPSTLTGLMMQELTKETVAAGGMRTDEKAERSLADGKVLTGLKTTLTINGENSFYEVLTYGQQNSGLIAVTRIDEKRIQSEGITLSTFWGTLEVK